MPGFPVSDKLEIAFNESAIADDDTDDKQFVSPGTAAVQVMIEGPWDRGDVLSIGFWMKNTWLEIQEVPAP